MYISSTNNLSKNMKFMLMANRNTIFSKVFPKTKITNSFLYIDCSIGIRFMTEIQIRVIRKRKMNQTLHLIKEIQVYLKRSVVYP